jgi:sulfur-oxidizing protein SoxY
MQKIDRRQSMVLDGALVAYASSITSSVRAESQRVADIIHEFTNGNPPLKGKKVLDLPLTAENGDAVPLRVSVESPIADDDYVRKVLILADGNPEVTVAQLTFTPGSGKAEAELRIRLVDTQSAIALANASKGTNYIEQKKVMLAILRLQQLTLGGAMIDSARFKLPMEAKNGDIVQIKVLLDHPMETGRRKDAQGKTIPRKTIDNFACEFEGNRFFEAAIGPATSANPYFVLAARVDGEGYKTFRFIWTDNTGNVQELKKKISIKA